MNRILLSVAAGSAACALVGLIGAITGIAKQHESVRKHAYENGHRDGWRLGVQQAAAGKVLGSVIVQPGGRISGCTFIIVPTNDLIAGTIVVGVQAQGSNGITDSVFDFSNMHLPPDAETPLWIR